jgi:hypothetical protein
MWSRRCRARVWISSTTSARHGQRFLDDAHQGGVLRRVGAVYQFRHEILQDTLASNIADDSVRRGAQARTGTG